MLSVISRSVRYKVVAVVLATTLVALLVSAIALFTYDAQNYRESLISDATTQADILASTTAPALQFDDPETATEILALLASRRDVEAAAIYDTAGDVFAEYLRGDLTTLPEAVPATGTEFTDGHLELFQPVVANGEVIGTVYLRAASDPTQRLQDYLLILGLVMLLSLGVAALISVYLQRSVTRPVLAVTELARRVMNERDFSLRARRTTDDEVGVLVDSFNAMLGEVGQMTETLRTTNRRMLEETEVRRNAEAALRLADERKDEFLATLAHELRNPLAPMVNALAIIEATTTENEARGARDIIRRQLEHMVRLIDDLLDVSRITRGKLSLQMAAVDLDGVITNAVDTAAPFIRARGHRLSVNVTGEPVRLRGDAVRLSQVFSNLLDNSAKYMEPGGSITLSAVRRGDDLQVRVSDTGMGMSPETMEQVFDMFAQGDDSHNGGIKTGLGVGLGLARRLVEMHGGSIQAHSEGPGKGSTFIVTLPIAPAATAWALTEPTGEAAPPHPAAMDGDRHRILLVDDNEDFVDSLGLLLRALGHEVAIAYDGFQALEVARQLGPDIAFLDLGLPELDGFQLALQLKEQPATAGTVLVALSGWGQARDRERSQAHGFVAHLVKPVNVETVQSTMQSLVAKS